MATHLIDHTVLQQLIDDLDDMAQEFILELVDALARDVQKSVDEMRQGLAAGDVKQVSEAAHRLKGSCANLGASHAANLCQELESFAGTTEHAQIEVMISDLVGVCEQTIQYFRAYSF